MLIQSGADVECRDTENRATPLAWALHVHMDTAIELLTLHTRDVFTLVAGGATTSLIRITQVGFHAGREDPDDDPRVWRHEVKLLGRTYEEVQVRLEERVELLLPEGLS